MGKFERGDLSGRVVQGDDLLGATMAVAVALISSGVSSTAQREVHAPSKNLQRPESSPQKHLDLLHRRDQIEGPEHWR